MAGINDYSNTAGSNTTINGIDIAEGCSPAGINNAIRQLMADIADIDDGVVPLQTPDINGGTIDGAIIGGTTPAAGTFTNLTATGTLTGLLGNVSEDSTPQLGGNLDTNGNDINFGDNDKAQFGASNDLQIYHNGSNSIIKEAGTGDLRISATNMYITNGADNESKAYFGDNGPVELYYDNSKKFETTSAGATVTGALTVTSNISTPESILMTGDNKKLKFGVGEDLQIYHNGTNSYIDDVGTGSIFIRADDYVIIDKSDGSKRSASFNTDDAVILNFNNNQKFTTTSTGVNVTGTVVSDGLTVDGNASLTTSGANGLVLNQRTDSAGNSANIFLSDSSGTVGIQSSSGALRFNTGATVGSASGTERLRINSSELVINDASNDYDFRVESDTNTHALFVDGSSNNVLIGTTDNSPAESSVNDGIRLGTNGGTQIGTNGLTVLTLNRNTNDGIHIDIRRQGSRIGYIGTNTSNLGLGTGDVGLLFDDALDTIFPANPDASLGTRNNAMDLGSASATFRRIYLGSAAVIQEQTLTDGATISWDVSARAVAKVTLGGNRTLSAPNSPIGSGQFISLLVIQDATGSRTLTWNAAYEFKDDTAPTLTTTAQKADLFTFRYNGTKWLEVGRNTNLSIS
jgi:hypothetical protein